MQTHRWQIDTCAATNHWTKETREKEREWMKEMFLLRMFLCHILPLNCVRLHFFVDLNGQHSLWLNQLDVSRLNSINAKYSSWKKCERTFKEFKMKTFEAFKRKITSIFGLFTNWSSRSSSLVPLFQVFKLVKKTQIFHSVNSWIDRQYWFLNSFLWPAQCTRT